jgi:fermentation-respiration switch protein FrsA (DUF1100 family)
MVATDDVKAGVIWAGMVGSYPEILEWWRQRWGTDDLPTPDPETGSRPGVAQLIETYGPPDEAPEFWNAISATSFLSDLSGPLQLHHGTADSSVPHVWSEALEERMEAAGQTVEFYSYPGDNHNLSNNFSLAMERSVDFFDTYVKGVRE